MLSEYLCIDHTPALHFFVPLKKQQSKSLWKRDFHKHKANLRVQFPKANLRCQPSITFSQQSNNVLSFLHRSKMKFPPTSSYALCKPGGVRASAGAGLDRTQDQRTGLPHHIFGLCRKSFQVSLSICILPSMLPPSRLWGQHSAPSLQHFWAQGRKVLCKGYPTAQCIGLKDIQNAKYRYTDFSGGLKLRGSWSCLSWQRLMMDSSELFSRKSRKYFECPPKRNK